MVYSFTNISTSFVLVPSFNKYLLSVYHVPGFVLSLGDTEKKDDRKTVPGSYILIKGDKEINM